VPENRYLIATQNSAGLSFHTRAADNFVH